MCLAHLTRVSFVVDCRRGLAHTKRCASLAVGFEEELVKTSSLPSRWGTGAAPLYTAASAQSAERNLCEQAGPGTYFSERCRS